jgi:hypothetical protein
VKYRTFDRGYLWGDIQIRVLWVDGATWEMSCGRWRLHWVKPIFYYLLFVCNSFMFTSLFLVPVV